MTWRATFARPYNLDAITSRELFTKFGLEAGTVDFVGHSLALQDNDIYLDQPARKMVTAAGLATHRSPRHRHAS
jgi:Rab GDP dissociation inhibitor